MNLVLRFLVFLLLISFPCLIFGQVNTWELQGNFAGSARLGAVSFTIGDFAYVGTGEDASGVTNDFWRYDPNTDSWTQIESFPGAPRTNAEAFSVGGKGYVGLGEDGTTSATSFNDFYAYDPTTNTWMQVADFGGGDRFSAVSFVVADTAYVGTGRNSVDEQNDFWKYDYVNDQWIQIADLNADKRTGAVAFTINGKGYVSGGVFFDSFSFQLSDVQEYDPATGQWTERVFADGVNLSFNRASSFVLDGLAYICYGNKSTVVTYDPVTNNIDNTGDVLGIGRSVFDPIAFAVGDAGYFGLGSANTLSNNIWRLGPPPPPSAPSNLTTQVVSQSIDLVWQDNSDNEDGFIIERAEGSMSNQFILIDSVVSNVEQFTDNTTAPATLYRYRVAAFNSAGTSPPSNISEARIPNNPPTGLRITADRVVDGVAAGTLVATLVLEDPDNNDQGSFFFIDGDGINDANNGDFSIDGDRLLINDNVDILNNSSYSVRIVGADLGGAGTVESFTINVIPAQDVSDVYVGTLDFKGIRRFELRGSDVDTLVTGSSVGPFDIDTDNQLIYYGGTSSQSIFVSDYDGNITLVKDSIPILFEDYLILNADASILYYTIRSSRTLYALDLVTQQASSVFVDTGSGFDQLVFDEINSIFYWIEPSNSPVLNTLELSTMSHKTFTLTDTNVSNLVVNENDNVLFYLSRASFSPEDTATIKAYEFNTDEFFDVSEPFGNILNFNLDKKAEKIYIAGDTAIESTLSTSLIRASLDGVVEEIVLTNFPSTTINNIVIDTVDNNIYWTEENFANGSSIFRSDLGMFSAERLFPFSSNFFETSYQIDPFNNVFVGVEGGDLLIAETSVGAERQPIVVSKIGNVAGVVSDVARGYLFWSDSDFSMIMRSDIDGSNVTTLVDDLSNLREVRLDPIRGKLLWFDQTNRIQSANLDGSEVETLVTINNFSDNFAFDELSNTLYWHDQEFINRSVIGSDNIEQLLAFDEYISGMDIDPDDGTLYFIASFFDPTLMRYDIAAGQAPDTIPTIVNSPRIIRVDRARNRVYHGDNSGLYQVNPTGERAKEIFTDLRFVSAFDLNVVNEAPQATQLSDNSITEMLLPPFLIGEFSTADSDALDRHIYYFESGDTTASNFQIIDNQLFSNVAFDFETRPNIEITIISEDIAGDTISTNFVINVLDSLENNPPTDIIFTQESQLTASTEVGTVLGSLRAVDVDTADEYVFQRISVDGQSDDNDLFRILENTIIIDAPVSDRVGDTLVVSVRAMDLAGASIIKPFEINILPDSVVTPDITSLDERLLDEVNIFPVPVNDILHVEFSNLSISQIAIVNLEGVSMRSQSVTGSSATVDVSTLSAGIYLLRIQTKDATAYRRIFITK